MQVIEQKIRNTWGVLSAWSGGDTSMGMPECGRPIRLQIVLVNLSVINIFRTILSERDRHRRIIVSLIHLFKFLRNKIIF